MLVMELVDDLAAVVERVGLRIVHASHAARESGLEGVERVVDGEIALMPVAVVGPGDPDRGPGAEGMVVRRREERGGPIDVPGVSQLDLGAGTDEVELLELHPGRVLPAAARVVEAGVERPHVAGGHAQIDLAVVVFHRTDPGVVEIVVGA